MHLQSKRFLYPIGSPASSWMRSQPCHISSLPFVLPDSVHTASVGMYTERDLCLQEVCRRRMALADASLPQGLSFWLARQRREWRLGSLSLEQVVCFVLSAGQSPRGWQGLTCGMQIVQHSGRCYIALKRFQSLSSAVWCFWDGPSTCDCGQSVRCISLKTPSGNSLP